jgi:hypothetical protein
MADAKTVPVQMLVSMASAKNDRDVDKIVYVSPEEAQRLFDKGFACEPGEDAIAAATAGKAKRGRPAKAAE